MQTLSSWKQRNQFRRSCLPQLGELLHWDGLDEESAARLGVELIEGRVPEKAETHPTEEALRRVNREYRIAEKVFRRYAGHTVRVLQTLGENCFYAFSAPTNTPYEFENTPEGHEIAVALAKALCKGTLCLYIRPNEEGVSYYRDTWGYGQLVYQEHAIDRDRGLPVPAQGLDGQGRGAGPAEDRAPPRPIASSTNGSTSAMSAARRCGCPGSA